MERLTKEELYCAEVGCDMTGCITDACYDKKIYDKLKAYEDTGEQGLLLRLPCKIGDDVYTIPSKVNYDLNILSGHNENNRVYHQKAYSVLLQV